MAATSTARSSDVGPTLHNFLFRFCYDHIFVKGPSEARVAVRSGVARDNRKASDHRPVWAEVEFGAGDVRIPTQAQPP